MKVIEWLDENKIQDCEFIADLFILLHIQILIEEFDDKNIRKEIDGLIEKCKEKIQNKEI